MSSAYGFSDLCINAETVNKKNIRELLQKLFERGYSTVAINQTVEESIFESEKKNKKKTGEIDTPSISVPNPLAVEELASEFAGKLRILSRITFVFADTTKLHTLNQSLNLRKYDLYAVVPKTQAAFQFACSQLSADIILLNKNCSGLKLSRKLYLQAAERGLHFEIQYCDVVDSSSRKFSIHYSHLFHMFGKSKVIIFIPGVNDPLDFTKYRKNVIITSGASRPSQIRSPYDVVNLASILGLNETKAKASILSQSRFLILKAEGRRFGKAVFRIQSSVVNEREEEENNEENNDCKNPKKIKL